MPMSMEHARVLPHKGALIVLRRNLLELVTRLAGPSATDEYSFDSAVTALMRVFIAHSEDGTQTMFPLWVSSLKFSVQQLNLNLEPCDMDEEAKEERRRYVFSSSAGSKKRKA
jgi:hypothetical protein